MCDCDLGRNHNAVIHYVCVIMRYVPSMKFVIQCHPKDSSTLLSNNTCTQEKNNIMLFLASWFPTICVTC